MMTVTEATCRIYKELKYFLRTTGHPIPENAVWIAVTRKRPETFRQQGFLRWETRGQDARAP